MSFLGKDEPKAPDPYKLGDAQLRSNLATAEAQARLGMTRQDTPWGTLAYIPDAGSPSGYRAQVTLTPDQEGLLNESTEAQRRYIQAVTELTTPWAEAQRKNLDWTGVALDRAGNAMETPFSLDAGRATILSDVSRRLMDPLWEQRAEAMRADLFNRGIREGSEQWLTAMRPFEDARARAYDDMFLSSYDRANQWALTERNIPFADLAALTGAAVPGEGLLGPPGSPGMPSWVNTPSPGVAPTDVVSPVMQNYAIQSQNYNANLGGMYGLGAAALGGWAFNGFPNPFA